MTTNYANTCGFYDIWNIYIHTHISLYIYILSCMTLSECYVFRKCTAYIFFTFLYITYSLPYERVCLLMFLDQHVIGSLIGVCDKSFIVFDCYSFMSWFGTHCPAILWWDLNCTVGVFIKTIQDISCWWCEKMQRTGLKWNIFLLLLNYCSKKPTLRSTSLSSPGSSRQGWWCWKSGLF